MIYGLIAIVIISYGKNILAYWTFEEKSKQEILLTIISVIDNNFISNIPENRILIDNRDMPSRYVLKK